MAERKADRRFLKAVFSFDNLMITIATIGLVGVAYFVPQNFHFLDPVAAALDDMDITDMVFSQFRDEMENGVDTNIVLVNIGLVGREEIAYMLDRVNSAEPAVVGIDAFFRTPRDPATDSLLMASMAATENLVLVSKVAYKEESREGQLDVWVESEADPSTEFDTLEVSDPMFGQYATTGFSNMVMDNEKSFMTVRSASLEETHSGVYEPSFAMRIVEIVDPEAAAAAKARESTTEVINFHGSLKTYYHFDVDQILDDQVDLSVMKGKIVLLGYMGPDLQTPSLEDIFYTPLNARYVGRSFPDMYGVVIHANIITMLMRGNYIGQMSLRTSLLIGLAVLLFNVVTFTFFYRNYENWYDMIAVAMQLGESLAILFLIVIVFDKLDYKLALTPALISVFLVGTVHDLYQDSIKKLILSGRARLSRRKSASSKST